MKIDKIHTIKFTKFLTAVTIGINIIFLLGAATIFIAVKQGKFTNHIFTQVELEQFQDQIKKHNNIEKLQTLLHKATKVMKSNSDIHVWQLSFLATILLIFIFTLVLNLATLITHQFKYKNRT